MREGSEKAAFAVHITGALVVRERKEGGKSKVVSKLP